MTAYEEAGVGCLRPLADPWQNPWQNLGWAEGFSFATSIARPNALAYERSSRSCTFQGNLFAKILLAL